MLLESDGSSTWQFGANIFETVFVVLEFLSFQICHIILAKKTSIEIIVFWLGWELTNTI